MAGQAGLDRIAPPAPPAPIPQQTRCRLGCPNFDKDWTRCDVSGLTPQRGMVRILSTPPWRPLFPHSARPRDLVAHLHPSHHDGLMTWQNQPTTISLLISHSLPLSPRRGAHLRMQERRVVDMNRPRNMVDRQTIESASAPQTRSRWAGLCVTSVRFPRRSSLTNGGTPSPSPAVASPDARYSEDVAALCSVK